MALTPLSAELNTIETLTDRPNKQSGITAEQLKALFDENAQIIKTYINETLLAELGGAGGAPNLGIFPNAHFPNISTLQEAIEYLYEQIQEVTFGALVDGSVTTPKLYQGAGQQAVTTDTVRDSAITAAKIATDAIITAKIQNGAVTTDKLGSGAVTNAKLSANAVGESNIANGAVSSDKLANASVTSDKLTSAIQTSLGKANSAVQPSRSVNGHTLENDVTVTKGDVGLKLEEWTFTPKTGDPFTLKVAVEDA